MPLLVLFCVVCPYIQTSLSHQWPKAIDGTAPSLSLNLNPLVLIPSLIDLSNPYRCPINGRQAIEGTAPPVNATFTHTPHTTNHGIDV